MVWVGFCFLALNAVVACWVALRRYRRAGQLHVTTVGVVTAAKEGHGRAPADTVVATYTVGGTTYTVSGSSDDDRSLTAQKYPVDSQITVYLSPTEPSIASLTSHSGYGFWAVTAVGLLLACGALAYSALANG